MKLFLLVLLALCTISTGTSPSEKTKECDSKLYSQLYDESDYLSDCLTNLAVKYVLYKNGQQIGICSCQGDNCEVLDGRCVPIHLVKPEQSILYPAFCDPKNPNKIACNFNGSGTVCPLGCELTSGICTPTRTGAVCQYQDDILCPSDCVYDRLSDVCVPYTPNAVCELDMKYAICPKGCSFDYNMMYCVDEKNPCYYDYNAQDIICPETDVVCHKRRRTVCPEGCRVENNRCLPNSDMKKNALCRQSCEPVCPSGCRYDSQHNVCKNDLRNQYKFSQPVVSSHDTRMDTPLSEFCEPMVITNCVGYNYYINTSAFANCNSGDYNYDDVCINSLAPYISLWYPLRLKKHYDNIMCDQSTAKNCYFTQTICD